VPRLWNDTIEGHRRAVQDATLDTTAALVAERGLRGVTMSQIAESTGIGRATLYKYFPDVESILAAWHERAIGAHLAQLRAARDRARGPLARLHAVLGAYAEIVHEGHGHHHAELATVLHDEQVVRAMQHLRALVTDLVKEAAAAGNVRDDIAPDELVTYSLHAVEAASDLSSKSAVRRLVEVTLAGLRPPV
jgi:AcrR family transcriptional regulator